MHYYQFNIGDYASHTARLSLMEDLAYRRIMDLYYLNEQPLNSCTTDVAREIGMLEHVDSVAYVLSKFFTLDENVFRQKRIDLEIKNYKSKLKSKSKAGKASAKARRSKALKGDTGVEQVLNTRSTNEQLTNNHKPITNNQEPIIKDMCPQAVTPDQKFNDEIIPKPKKPQKRFTKPAPSDIANYCEERKNFVDAEKFFNHYESNGWRVGKNPMKDWKAAVRTWEKNSFQNNTGNSNAKNIGSNSEVGEFDFLDDGTEWIEKIYEERGMQFGKTGGGSGHVQRDSENVVSVQTGMEDLGNQKP